jgi:hypothetical protein
VKRAVSAGHVERRVSYSVKSQRILDQLGVPAALARGEALVLVGPTYTLRKEPSTTVRLAFLRDEDRRLCVGYARNDGSVWAAVEFEPFSLRALGYYERRLKRVGEFASS